MYIKVKRVEAAKLMELGDPLHQGLLADRVLDILSSEKQLRPEDRQVLNGLKEFIEHAEDGSEQVKTGKLSENALASISAYRATIMSLPPRPLEKDTRDHLARLLNDVRKEIDLALENGKILSSESENLRTFSRALRMFAINTVGKSLGREAEVLVWSRTTTR